MNGHAAWSDGSAATGFANWVLPSNTFVTPVIPRCAQTSCTMRVVWVRAPWRLASQGGTAGITKVANPARLTVTTSVARRRNRARSVR